MNTRRSPEAKRSLPVAAVSEHCRTSAPRSRISQARDMSAGFTPEIR